MSRMIILIAILLATAPVHGQSFLGRDKSDWRRQLDSTEAVKRRSAAFALGKIGGSISIPPLIHVLETDDDVKVKETAAFALGEIGVENDRAVNALKKVLANGSENALVRRSAAVALGNIGRSASGALSALEAALGDGDPNLRQNVAWALGRVSGDSGPALERALRDADTLVKRDAANSISHLQPSEARVALPALLECCETGNSELRKSVLGPISKLVSARDKGAIGSLKQALADRDTDVRIAAALSMANIGGEDAAKAALPTLKSALKDGDIGLRRQAAAVLRNFGEAASSVVPELKGALTHEDDQLRANAAVGLGGIGEAAAGAIPDLVNRIVDSAEKAHVRTAAANALSTMGTPPAAVSAVPKLLKVLGDPSAPAKVRERILWALRPHNVELRNLNVFPTFEKILLEKSHPEAKMLRYDSAYMLGMLQGAEASKKTVEVLDEWLQDSSIQIYKGTDAGGEISGNESGTKSSTKVDERGASDGRVMVLQALDQIGLPVVVSHVPAIRAHLQSLLAEKRLDPDLKREAEKLLKGSR